MYESWYLMFGRMIAYPLVTYLYDGMFGNAGIQWLTQTIHIKHARVVY